MKIKNKKLIIPIGIGVVLAVVGTVGALNGWFGGGAKIPEDTMTRGLAGYWSMDETTGPLVFDKSGQGNDGMINDGGSGNPVSYWTFDEGSGQTAYDYTGSNNGILGSSAGSDASDPVWTSSGRVGGAVQFDGTDDRVNVGSDTSLDNITVITIEAWIYPKGWGGGKYGRILDKYSRLFSVSSYSSENRLDYQQGFSTSGGGWSTPNNSITLNTWQHVTVVYDNSNTANDPLIYINGVSQAITETVPPVGSANSDASYDAYIGNALTGIRAFDGLIDDVRIYNYARSAAQIQRDYSETYKTKFAGGKVGTALQFDGVDDYVDLGDNDSLNLSGNLTIESWVYITGGTSKVVIGSTASSYFKLQIDETTTLFVRLNNPDVGGFSNTVPSALNSWHHYVAIREGSTAKVYWDGKLLSNTGPSSGTLRPDLIGTNNISPIQNVFNGLVDEVRIYNRALSAEEVRYHYNRGGPVAEWKFDEGSGTTAYDSTNNGNDGTLTNGPTWTTGKYGTALSFDGVNDYVDVVDNTSLRFGTDDFTIEAWINTISTFTGQMIVSNYNAADQFFAMWVQNGGKFMAYYRDAPILETMIASDSPVNDGKWHHVVAQRAGDYIYIYVDGVKQVNIGTGVDNANFDPNGGWEVGHQQGSADRYFSGLIDDVRIYNYARSADEIRLDYNAGFGVRFGGSPAEDMTRGLVGYWNMDEGDGGYVYDQSDYKNTGYVRPIGKALQFDGSNDYVDAGSGTSLDLTNAGTITFWYKSDSTQADWMGLVTKGSISAVSNYSYVVYKSSISDIRLSISNGVSTNEAAKIVDYTDGKWHFVVAKWDGSQLVIAVDNVYSTLGTQTFNAQVITGSLKVGYSGGQYFNGLIDDVRIYNRALTTTEITEHYKGIFSNESGLVGNWPFDEGYGTTAYDKSGKGNNGTLGGGVAANMPTWKNNAPKFAAGAPAAGGGSQGTALQFDGVDDYVEVPHSTSLNIDYITLAVWAKVSYRGTYDSLVRKSITPWGEPHGSYALEIDGPTGKMDFQINIGGVRKHLMADFIPDVWHHFVGTFNGEYMRLYIDGVEVANQAQTGVIVDTDQPLYIGAGDDFIAYCSGIIDEVRIYNRALSAEEIRYHYNRGGPVAQWKFDEGTGTTTYDGTNNNNDGVLGDGTCSPSSGNCPAWASGKYGSALSFDGTDDYVNVGHGASLDITNTITIEAWVKYNGSALAYPMIVAKGFSANHVPYQLRIISSSRNFYFMSYQNGVERGKQWFSYVVPIGSWIHVAVTLGASTITLYVNGSQYESSAWPWLPLPINTADVWIGNYTNGDPFSGVIDDVRIYNYARTQDQIRQDYNEGLAVRFGPTPMSPAGCDLDPAGCITKGLVGSWSMDEGSGGYVYDQSDYKNTGYARPDGKALYFDGTDDYINAGNDKSLDISGSQNFTWEAWVKRSRYGAWEDFLAKDAYYEYAMLGFYSSWNQVAIYFKFADGTQSMSNFAFTPSLDTWYHYVLVHQGTDFLLYANGQYTSTWSPGKALWDTSIYGFNIGGSAPGGGRNFKGSIDEVRVYKRALSSTEAAEHYKGIFSNEAGLVGYWPLDEGYGDKTYDKSGKGNNGTLLLGPTWKNNAPKWAAGAPAAGGGSQGNALQFDGVDDYVDCGNGASLRLTSNFTLEAWVKPDVNAYQQIISNQNDNLNGYRLRLQSGGQLEIILGNASGPTLVQASVGTTSAGEWAHVAFVYGDTKVYLYINAIKESWTTQPEVTTSAEPLRIGIRQLSGGTEPFDGLIDEVRIYNRALSLEEVRYHYNRGGPVAHWKFDEGSGDYAYDSTNNNNDGTLGGGVAANKPTWTAGKYGSALQFDGVDDYVSCGNIENMGSEYTVEAWFNSGTFSANDERCLWSPQGDGTRPFPTLYRAGSGDTRFAFYSHGTHSWGAGGYDITQNVWHYSTFVVKGSVVKTYLDGGLFSIKDFGGDDIGGNFTNFTLGKGDYGKWNGLIDDVRIYNYARTPEQILIDYNAGLSTYFK